MNNSRWSGSQQRRRVIVTLCSLVALSVPGAAIAGAATTSPVTTIAMVVGGKQVATFSSFTLVKNAVPGHGPVPAQPAIFKLKGLRGRMAYVVSWRRRVRQSAVKQLQTFDLVMFQSSGTHSATYRAVDASPTKVVVTAVKAGASTVLVATVTFDAVSIKLVAP